MLLGCVGEEVTHEQLAPLRVMSTLSVTTGPVCMVRYHSHLAVLRSMIVRRPLPNSGSLRRRTAST